MRIEKEYRRLEDIWEISIFDARDEDFYVPCPREFDVEEIPVMELMSNIDTDEAVIRMLASMPHVETLNLSNGNTYIEDILESYPEGSAERERLLKWI